MIRKTDLMKELIFSIKPSVEKELYIEWIANDSLMQAVIFKRNYYKLCAFMRLNYSFSES